MIKTRYPVTIDPTLTISDTTATEGAIEDTILFSNRPSKNYGDYVYLSIGYVDSTYGVGRVAVKLPGLYNSTEYQNITSAEITSVKFYCYDTSGNSTQAVNLYRITTSSWDENTVTYGDSLAYSTAANWGASMASSAWTAFDITSLVKLCKNGSYSAQSGFMLVNSNEASASYKKAPYSSEYSNSSFRPYVVFTYDPEGTVDITNGGASVDVKEGEVRQLTATNPYGIGFSWSSSNTAVATVSSTGMVTAHKAGAATISAGFVQSAATYTVSCTVYVYIDIGAFYIQNNNSGHYLHVQYGKINDNTNVYQLEKYLDTTADTTKIRQIWRIRHLGQGRYSLRPLHKLDMALDVTGTNVDIYTVGSVDTLASVPSRMEWEILWSNNGYVIKNSGSNNKTLQIENSSTASGANVNVGAYTGGASQKWTLERISSPPKGVIMYSTTTGSAISSASKTIVNGETKTLADFNLTVVSYQTVSPGNLTLWSSSDTSVATVSSAGIVSAQSCGTATITASANNKTVSYSLTVIPIAEGTYFINNRERGGYIQLDDDASDDFAASGVIMEHHEFDGEDYQKWEFIHVSNGFYKIRSVESGLYLAVPSDGIDESDVDIVQEDYSNLSRKQWTVVPTSNGAFKIRNRAVTSDLVLCVNWGVSDGDNIQQDDYVDNDSYLDEWYICEYDTSILMAINDSDGADRHSYFTDTKNNLQTANNSKVSIVSARQYSSLTATQMIDYMQSNDIFIIHTHGNKQSFKISNTQPQNLHMNDLTGVDLSNLKFALLMTCETGLDYDESHITNNTPVNIVEKMVLCGAETVVGFKALTYVSDCNDFAKDVTKNLIENALSVEDAIENINYDSYMINMNEIAVIAGNANNTLR